jgi:23S rRNA pseudouridine1911/1915/1917 synthase
MVRLVDHLRSLGLSGRAARQALETGKVRYKRVPVADAGRLVDPAEVVVDANAPKLVPGRDPAIVHRDEALVVVYKPSGWLSVPAPGRRDPDLLGFVGRLFGSALPVHRIDEETSGLVVVALTATAQRQLKQLFEVHAVERRYLAIVAGRFGGPRTLRSTLVRDRGDGRRGSDESEDGKEAITHVRAVEALGGSTVIEARLETGRTHQVRIHLSEAGYPILGDPLYAPAAVARRSARLALHAFVLGFEHPAGNRLFFEAPLADDLEMLRRRLAGSDRRAAGP